MSLIAPVTQYPGISIASRASAASTVTAATVSTTKVAVSDSLANLKANLGKLQANIKNVSSITVTETGVLETGVLSFTGADLLKYKDVIAKIDGNRSLKATDVNLASLSNITKNKSVTLIDINDGTLNIQNNMSSLIASNAKLGVITKSDANALAIDDKNYVKANVTGGVFSKIVPTLTAKVNITGVAASDVIARLGDTKVNTVSVSDSLTNIVAKAVDLTTSIAKVSTVNVSGAAKTTLKASDYTTFLGKTALLGKIVTPEKPNALNKAFTLTEAALSDSLTTGSWGSDAKVMSIAVKSALTASTGTGSMPAASLLSSKVAKVDLTVANNTLFAGNVANMAALGKKLASVQFSASPATGLTLNADVIRDKANASVIAKTTGSDKKPVGVTVSNALLSDFSTLLANKQVNHADIVSNVKDLLAFSNDGFAAIPVSSTITITLADNATNINDNSAKLAVAIANYKDKVLSLDVTDTAEKLGTNIGGLHDVIGALKDANVGNTNIKIHQVNGTTGLADTTSNVKVTFAQYTADHDVLEYIKTDTGNAKGVEIVAGENTTGIDIAKTIGFQIQMADFVSGGMTGTVPAPGNPISGTTDPTADTTNLAKYRDVAKIDISFKSIVGKTAIEAYNDMDTAADPDLDFANTSIAMSFSITV